MMDFSILLTDKALLKSLASTDWQHPTRVQAEAIPAILSGSDVVICSETGSGKTASFVLPILDFILKNPDLREPLALILTPTRELATQIMTLVSQLNPNHKIRVANLCGGMAYIPQAKRLRSGVQLIIATPGRLIDFIEKRRITLDKVKMLVLDEAERMLNPDFILAIDNINSHLNIQKQIILVSATLNMQIRRTIEKWLKKPIFIDFNKTKLIPETIQQKFYIASHSRDKFELLLHLLKTKNINRALIFVSTQLKAEELSKKLNATYYRALPLHGKLKQHRRSQIMKLFSVHRINFIVTTDLIARGLDIQPLNYIINFDPPKNNSQYIHRVGRVGRNKQPGIAFSLTLPRDQRIFKKLSKYLGIIIKFIPYHKNIIPISNSLKEEERNKFCNTAHETEIQKQDEESNITE